MRRQRVWSLSCLLWISSLVACSSADADGPGGGDTGASSPTGSSDTSGHCSDTPLAMAACVTPAEGFPDWRFAEGPPLQLSLTATVTEIGEGDPPLGCFGSRVTFGYHLGLDDPTPVWARLLDGASNEWAVAFAVPTLAAGFNGYIAPGDTVQVAMHYEEVITFDQGEVSAQLSISRDDVLVAYASQQEKPPWYDRGADACESSDECCKTTQHEAHVELNGESGVVPHQQTAVIGGLAISNIEYADYADLGCCNFSSDIALAAAAVPVP